MATRVVMYAPGVAQVHARSTRYARDLAGDMAGDMRIYAPVRTGLLKSTIRTMDIHNGARIWVGNVALGCDYHLFQEYGTEHMRAQPYVRPAVYQWRGRR